MRTGTTIWSLRELYSSAMSNSAEINGKWVPARPYGWDNITYRMKAAWLVFTGKADVVIWPEGQ